MTIDQIQKDERMRRLVNLYKNDPNNGNNNELAELIEWLDLRLSKLEKDNQRFLKQVERSQIG